MTPSFSLSSFLPPFTPLSPSLSNYSLSCHISLTDFLRSPTFSVCCFPSVYLLSLPTLQFATYSRHCEFSKSLVSSFDSFLLLHFFSSVFLSVSVAAPSLHCSLFTYSYTYVVLIANFIPSYSSSPSSPFTTEHFHLACSGCLSA